VDLHQNAREQTIKKLKCMKKIKINIDARLNYSATVDGPKIK
jgi:hypothetical protein